jgi:hypothetical protein
MTTLPKRPRDRRVALVGCIAVTVILLVGRGVPRLSAWTREARESARTLATEEQRALIDLHSLPIVGESAQARRYALGDALPTLLHGVTTAAITASLAEIVSDAASDAGLRVGAIDVRADTAGTGSYVRVTARTDLTGDVRGLATLLSGLESSGRRLAIRELSIVQSMPAAPAQQAEVLRATMVLDGLARRPAGGRATNGGSR